MKNPSNPAEDKKNTAKKVTDPGVAEVQPEKVESLKSDQNKPAVNLDSRSTGKEALAIYYKIEKIKADIIKAEDDNLIITGLLKIKSTYDSRIISGEQMPSADQKKVMRLQKKANKSFIVAATAQLDLERKNLNKVLGKASKEVDSQMTSDKNSSLYFLKKNKGHIKNKLESILETLSSSEPRLFRQLQGMASSSRGRRKENFESQILAFIKSQNESVYKKCIGVDSFRKDMLDFIREQFSLS